MMLLLPDSAAPTTVCFHFDSEFTTESLFCWKYAAYRVLRPSTFNSMPSPSPSSLPLPFAFAIAIARFCFSSSSSSFHRVAAMLRLSSSSRYHSVDPMASAGGFVLVLVLIWDHPPNSLCFVVVVVDDLTLLSACDIMAILTVSDLILRSDKVAVPMWAAVTVTMAHYH